MPGPNNDAVSFFSSFIEGFKNVFAENFSSWPFVIISFGLGGYFFLNKQNRSITPPEEQTNPSMHSEITSSNTTSSSVKSTKIPKKEKVEVKFKLDDKEHNELTNNSSFYNNLSRHWVCIKKLMGPITFLYLKQLSEEKDKINKGADETSRKFNITLDDIDTIIFEVLKNTANTLVSYLTKKDAENFINTKNIIFSKSKDQEFAQHISMKITLDQSQDRLQSTALEGENNSENKPISDFLKLLFQIYQEKNNTDPIFGVDTEKSKYFLDEYNKHRHTQQDSIIPSKRPLRNNG